MLSVGMRVCVRVWKRTREPLCVRKRRRERAAQPARDAAWGRDQSCVRVCAHECDPAGKCASRGCGQASAYVCPCAAECTANRATDSLARPRSRSRGRGAAFLARSPPPRTAGVPSEARLWPRVPTPVPWERCQTKRRPRDEHRPRRPQSSARRGHLGPRPHLVVDERAAAGKGRLFQALGCLERRSSSSRPGLGSTGALPPRSGGAFRYLRA